VIVLAWVSDEETLRACGSRTDAYATFRKMLDRGNPPETFAALMKEAVAAAGRFEKGLAAAPGR
jgi:toxin YhaV